MKKFIIVIMILVLLGLGAFYFLKKTTDSKIEKIKIEELDTNDIGVNEEVKNKENLNSEKSEFRNILLLGIDTHYNDYVEGNRSDSIIIANINNKTKDVKLCSVYRDTFLSVIDNNGKEILDKVTHAYAFGNSKNALKSINTSLDLNIKEYITVNFAALTDVIDTIGGVEIDIDSQELIYINGYIKDTSIATNVPAKKLEKPGKYTLTGVQAVAYSRIRYTAGGDYKRAERQREVLDAMFKKAKTLSLNKINEMLDKLLPEVSTNLKKEQIQELLLDLMNYKIKTSIGWPYNLKGHSMNKFINVPITLEKNVERLHKEFFEEENYTTSKKVKELSKQIIEKTGLK